MRKLLIIASLLLLTACGSNPIKYSFPDTPDKLMAAPKEMTTILKDEDLKKIDPKDESASEVPLSVVIKSVITNYGVCYENKEQLIDLQDWVRKQKALNP